MGKSGKSKKSKKSKKGEEKKCKKGGKKEKKGHHDNSKSLSPSQEATTGRNPELRRTLAPPVAYQNSDYSKITRSNNSHLQRSNHSRLQGSKHSHLGSDFSNSPLSSTYIKPDNDRYEMHHAAPIHVVTDGSYFRNLNSEITYFSEEIPHRKLVNTNPFENQPVQLKVGESEMNNKSNKSVTYFQDDQPHLFTDHN